MPPSSDEVSQQPATRAGRVLLAGLGSDFDPDSPRVWQDLSQAVEEVAAEDVAVLIAAAMTSVQGLFGAPADVRAITRWLREARHRLPGAEGLPMRQIEALVRVFAGEAWLFEFIDHEAIFAAGVDQLVVWRELMIDYLGKARTDARALVAAAERQAADGGLAAQVGGSFHTMVQALRADPDAQLDLTPAAERKLREMMWEERGAT